MTKNSTSEASLRDKLQNKTAVIGVIGLGYVGLPLTRTFFKAGYDVVAYDTDASRVDAIRRGSSYIRHISDASMAELARSGRCTVSTTFSDLRRCDACAICLPTPVGAHNEPDMSYVTSTAERLARSVLHPGMLVVLESTTYPGATDTDMVRILGQSKLALGADYFLAFSPEREDPGNKQHTTHTIPKLVGGVDRTSGALATLLYQQGGFERVEHVSSARVAECAKLLENTYRAVNIALVNELKGVFRGMGVDIWEVLDAAATKPFGFQRFDPGPGIGGHCIPVDPFYLTWKAREAGASCSFIELAALVNAGMPAKVVSRVQWALNEASKPVRGARVLLLGIAYKPDVDDIRCAPALDVWAGLRALGARVAYHDPYVPRVCATRKHAQLAGEASVPLCARGVDAVVVLTHHACFGRYAELQGFPGPVVDTRNCVPRAPGLWIVPA